MTPLQRVVVQALIYAAQTEKKRFRVYVTESRPVRQTHARASLDLDRSDMADKLATPRAQFGLGLKTHALLTAAGIECVVVLDSAVAYVMAKVSPSRHATPRHAAASRRTPKIENNTCVPERVADRSLWWPV